MRIAVWLLLAGFGLGLCAPALHAADYYIVNAQNQKQKVDRLEVQDGRVIVVQGGAKSPLNRRLFPYVISPEPKAVDAAQKALAQGQHKRVLSILDDKVFDQYKLLGWGPVMAMMRAEALLAQGDPDAATRELLQGRKLHPTREQGLRVNVMLARALIARGSFSDAEALLRDIETDDKDIAPRLYLMRGQIAEKRGQPREAILEYLKVVLVFEDAGTPRKQALERVVALMEDQRDRRSTVFREMLNKEYP